MPAAIAVPAIIGAAGVGAQIYGAHRASSAATGAAQTQAQSADQALSLQRQMWETQQRNIAPWLNVGGAAATTLGQAMGLGSVPGSTTTRTGADYGPAPLTNWGAFVPPTGGITGGVPMGDVRGPDGGVVRPQQQVPNEAGLTLGGIQGPGAGQPSGSVTLPTTTAPGTGGASVVQPFTDWTQPFVPPTGQTMQAEPGYQFRLAEGQRALERAASARGTLNTGGTLRAVARYGQDYASNEYQNVYNRAAGEYGLARENFLTNQANRYNRLRDLAGFGQTAASQAGSAASGYGNAATDLITGRGNAQAAGQVGSANAWTSAIPGIGNSLMDMYSQWSMNRAPATQPTTTLGNLSSYTPPPILTQPWTPTLQF